MYGIEERIFIHAAQDGASPACPVFSRGRLSSKRKYQEWAARLVFLR
jgi:hypothetical protein